jgi:5-methylcytosine-specific restriction endonuclease McrA
MCAKAKHSQLKKTPAGESGLSKRTPSHSPGIVSADPAGASYMTYAEQLKSPKWQKKRLEILERDNFKCITCRTKDKQLSVHHIFYLKGIQIYDYPNEFYITLCNDCHDEIHKQTELLYRTIIENAMNLNGSMLIHYFKALRVAVKLGCDETIAFSEFIDNYVGSLFGEEV